MTKKTKAVLWLHMHQPDYVIPGTNLMYLPWVRRHALRGYYMIPKLLINSGAKLNINFSGILLRELQLYEMGEMKDIYQYYEEKDTASLTEAERSFIIERFLIPLQFSSERFNALFEKKSKSEKFSNQEIRDIQVLFALSAFAPLDEDIVELLKKERDYTENEKTYIKEVEKRIINSIFPLYRSLMDKGLVEITVSPFYHPILPLLLDLNSARESKQGAIIPAVEFSYPEDASRQIQMSIDICKEIFGIKPKGMWPSEGSISNEAVDIIKSSGFEWIGTDELLLEKSSSTAHLASGVYNLRGIKTLFRDHISSDKLGFVYNKTNPEEAISDLLSQFKNSFCYRIIIIDGENPWDYYRNNGVEFLKSLFQVLSEQETALGSEVEACENIDSVKPGSWVNGYLDTWIGDRESNTAWVYLSEARQRLASNELSLKAILSAEGSDFFWWYSEFHRQEVDYSFDFLFRSKLIDAYRRDNIPIPSYLFYPIKRYK